MATGPSITVSAAGPYTATITDQFGCTSTCTATLVVNPNPVVAVGDASICPLTAGGSPATISASVTVGTAPFKYVWTVPATANNPGDVASFQASVAGDYCVTVTDAKGCKGGDCGTLTVFAAPSCAVSPPSQNGTPGSTLTYTISFPNGTPPFTWVAKRLPALTVVDSGIFPTDGTITVTAPAANTTENFRVDVTDGNGCTTSCSFSATGACVPSLVVRKTVACKAPGVDCKNATGYGETATGVKADPESPNNEACDSNNPNCPAFCFRIEVENTGGCDLVNVIVKDGGVTVGTIASLPAKTTADPIFLQRTICAIGATENTATASGTVSGTTQIVNAAPDTATAIVKPISIECTLQLFAVDALDGTSCGANIQVPAETPAGTTLLDGLRLAIHNNGQAAANITGVLVGGATTANCRIFEETDLVPADKDNNLCTGTIAPIDPQPAQLFPITVPQGGWVFIVCDITEFACPGGTITATVSAEATADAAEGVTCIRNSCGEVIKTADSGCSALISCVEAPTCRTTGGGDLLPGLTDFDCVEVVTTIIPSAGVAKITHGGQLGAPFALETCFNPGSECIRGQWQHVRHYNGRGNPRDELTVDNFHSNTPKGVFDMVKCACLGCCQDGVLHNPTPGELCFPKEHQVCGPEPRPAPANAIIFSGLGRFKKFTGTGNAGQNSEEWVVFRVYIEDRSEPGGVHPGGSKPPADIYCFQAWRTGIAVTQTPNAANLPPAVQTLRESVARKGCEWIGASRPMGSLPRVGDPVYDALLDQFDHRASDIEDCGPLAVGNRQIHPSTSATCTQ